MIIKTSIGSSFGGCVRYNLEKEKAEVLCAEGLRMDNPTHMTEDFNLVRKTNPELGKAVWHTSISFAPDDKGKVTDELMKSIAKDYATKFKLEQYAVIRHKDGKQEHFHIIANRVGYDGKTISDQYCASRGVELSHRLEKKYELHQQKGKRLELTNQDKLHGRDKAKYEIYEKVQKELPNSKSLEDLKTKLQTHGISTVIKPEGMSFAKGVQSFKASAVDHTLGMKNMLTKALEKAIPVIKPIKIVKNIIEKGFGHELEM